MITLKARTSIHNSPCVCMLTACPGYKFEREAICVACVLPVQRPGKHFSVRIDT
jgi:hypothetical protein